MGGYPDLNREPTVPHTVALPIELYPPLFFFLYVGVNRTLMSKYQKFMTYRLVYNIFSFYTLYIITTANFYIYLTYI